MHLRHVIALLSVLSVLVGCAPSETLVVAPAETAPPPREEAARPEPAPAPPKPDYGYAQQTGGVKVVSVTVEPSVVEAGSSLVIVVDYLVDSSHNGDVDVMETLEVRYGDVLKSMPTYTWSVRPGRQESRVKLTVPPNAESGTYDVSAFVSTEDGSDTREGYFRVL